MRMVDPQRLDLDHADARRRSAEPAFVVYDTRHLAGSASTADSFVHTNALHGFRYPTRIAFA
jgi:hypothetical protein